MGAVDEGLCLPVQYKYPVHTGTGNNDMYVTCDRLQRHHYRKRLDFDHPLDRGYRRSTWCSVCVDVILLPVVNTMFSQRLSEFVESE
jgi:hypothetical protein